MKIRTLEELAAAPYEAGADTEEWMRSRPNTIKRLLVKFPPGCILRAKDEWDLHCPAKGELALILSWTEPTPDCPEGTISCAKYPDGKVRAWCKPEWLEVVHYTCGMTPEKVKEILGWKEDN